jgi:hypothetical protein
MYIRVPQEPRLGESPASVPRFIGLAGSEATSAQLTAMAPALLCASNLTYSSPTQPTSSDKHYFRQAKFLGPPEIIDGVSVIHRCLIGTIESSGITPAPNSVVLAFRGTVPPQINAIEAIKSFFDWCNDFQAALVPVPEIQGLAGVATALRSVRVHAGFLESIVSLFRKGIADKLRARIETGAPLYVTGHSKGGALAHLAALLLQTAGLKVAGVISFEAPRAGDSSFKVAYEGLGINSLRYEFQNDIAPHVPPNRAFPDLIEKVTRIPPVAAALSLLKVKRGSFAYEPVGALRFIDWDGRTRISDTKELQKERSDRLKAAFTDPRELVKFGAMHAIDCSPTKTSGVWKAVCGTDRCG